MPRIFDLDRLELANTLLDAVFADKVLADCTHNCRIDPEGKCGHNRPSIPAVYYGRGLVMVIEAEVIADVRSPDSARDR